MTCSAPKQEWTIDTLIDGRPETEKARLVFCLSIEDGIINGEVSDLTHGPPVKLSPVTGNSRPFVELGLEIPPTLMTLTFTWGTSRVVLAGNTFQTDVTNNFRGRFTAFKTAAVNGGSNPPGGTVTDGEPGEDTGTGTGTQT